jgi:hypothetical protein
MEGILSSELYLRAFKGSKIGRGRIKQKTPAIEGRGEIIL